MKEDRDFYLELSALAKRPNDASSLLDEIGALWEAENDDSKTDVHEGLYALLENPVLCAKALLMWLADPPQVLAADVLIRRLSVEHLEAQHAVLVPLPTTSVAEALTAGRRMNARYIVPPYALGWVLAILKSWPDDPATIEGSDRILHYLVSEFPASLGRLLLNLETEKLQGRGRELIEHYRDQLNEERTLRESYPFLRELAMDREERDVQRVLQRNWQRTVLRTARQRSVLLQFVTQRRFKYARNVSFHVPGKPAAETPVQMKSHSVETELPESEWADPINGERLRLELWK